MRAHRSSFTADVVATARAAMATDYLGNLIDDDGRAALPAVSRLFLRGLDTSAAPVLWRAFERAVGATGYLAGRTMYFDARIREALDVGVDQIVLVGAGFDTRAVRLARDGVCYFEVDHPATQAAKRERIGAGDQVHHIAADLTVDSLYDALADTCFDPARPAFFLWEGVTMYLEPEDIDRTLSAMAALAAPGSVLSLDATDRPEKKKDTVASHIRRHLVARAGEPFRFTASIESLGQRMRDHGWDVTDSANATQIFDRYCRHTCMRPPRRPTNYVVTAGRRG